MGTRKQKKLGSDEIALVILSEVAGIVLVCSVDFLSNFIKLSFIYCFLLSIIPAFIGKERKIGFLKAFFASFLLSPLIGFIVAATSSRLHDEQYQEKMLTLAENSVSSSVADQLHKLNELRKEGVLTNEEFSLQKEKLLNQ